MHDIIHSGTVEALLFNFPQGKEKRAALTGDVAECGHHFSDTERIIGEGHGSGKHGSVHVPAGAVDECLSGVACKVQFSLMLGPRHSQLKTIYTYVCVSDNVRAIEQPVDVAANE